MDSIEGSGREILVFLFGLVAGDMLCEGRRRWSRFQAVEIGEACPFRVRGRIGVGCLRSSIGS